MSAAITSFLDAVAEQFAAMGADINPGGEHDEADCQTCAALRTTREIVGLAERLHQVEASRRVNGTPHPQPSEDPPADPPADPQPEVHPKPKPKPEEDQ